MFQWAVVSPFGLLLSIIHMICKRIFRKLKVYPNVCFLSLSLTPLNSKTHWDHIVSPLGFMIFFVAISKPIQHLGVFVLLKLRSDSWCSFSNILGDVWFVCNAFLNLYLSRSLALSLSLPLSLSLFSSRTYHFLII